MDIRIIDTADCIDDIRPTVEVRRLTRLLSMSRWVPLVSVVFGALGVVLAAPQLGDRFLYVWYGMLLCVSALLWLLTWRPNVSVVNLYLSSLQWRFLLYALSLALLWVVYGWYLALFLEPTPGHLFVAMQVQAFCLINCSFLFLNSRLVAYGFFLSSMVSPAVLFVVLSFLSPGSGAQISSLPLLRWVDYYWLMAFLQLLYVVLFFFSIKRMAAELASAVRLRALYELSNSHLMRVNHELESESNTDYLTGVANRRAYENGVQREWNRCLRNSSLFTVAVLDIDHFKLFNDRYGHLAGDNALKEVAGAIVNRLRRPGDLVARYGGEEFVAVVTGTPLADCLRLAEELCQSVRDLGLQHEDSPVDRVLTVSIGLAQCQPTPDMNPRKLFDYADAALYHAKQQGRNRTVVYDESISHILQQAGQERRRKSAQRGRHRSSSSAPPARAQEASPAG